MKVGESWYKDSITINFARSIDFWRCLNAVRDKRIEEMETKMSQIDRGRSVPTTDINALLDGSQNAV